MRDRKLVGSRQRSLSRRFSLPRRERPLLAGNQFSSVYRFSSFLEWDSRVSRTLANEKLSFFEPSFYRALFQYGENEAEIDAETVDTGWSVSTSRVLIQLYNENPLLWDKNHKEYGKKNIITMKPLLAKLRKRRAPHTYRGGCEKNDCTGLEAHANIHNLKKKKKQWSVVREVCHFVFWAQGVRY